MAGVIARGSVRDGDGSEAFREQQRGRSQVKRPGGGGKKKKKAQTRTKSKPRCQRDDWKVFPPGGGGVGGGALK